MRGWPLVFALAALFNLPIGLVFLLAPQVVHAALHMPDAPAIATRALGWCVLMFGLNYAVIAGDPPRNRRLAQASVVGKSGIFALVAAYALAGQAPLSIVALATGDLIWVLVFVRFLHQTRSARA